MSIYVRDVNRRLIPRWRTWHPSSLGSDTQRISRHAKGVDIGRGNTFFDEKLREFENQHSVVTATELLAASVVSGDGEIADIASEFLARNSDAIQPAVREILRPESSQNEAALDKQDALDFLAKTQDLYDQIGRFRSETRTSPRNALSWTNLARAYMLVGLEEKAMRNMRMALKLAPNNRYVLRCAARLYIHIGRPSDAATILRSSDICERDPWVMAAEISASEIAGIGSRTARKAKKLLADPSDPAHLTELAGSFATLQLYAGNRKGAAKNFRYSLIQPTENSVAQAAWAALQIPGVRPTDEHLEIENGFEVRAITYYRAGEIDKALDCLARWGVDEPYSSRPFINGSYIACIAARDYDRAARFCEFGLLANSRDTTLLNNYAVSLAMIGDLPAARQAFGSAISDSTDRLPDYIRNATEGLLLFREGNSVAGRAMYIDAIEHAPESYKALIAMHLVQEETHAQTDELESAISLAKSMTHPKGRPEVEQFEKMLRKELADQSD